MLCAFPFLAAQTVHLQTKIRLSTICSQTQVNQVNPGSLHFLKSDQVIFACAKVGTENHILD